MVDEFYNKLKKQKVELEGIVQKEEIVVEQYSKQLK